MNALEKIIRGIVSKQGPISMAAYMELALQHPDYGYYRKREPLGREGDFITAPEVSQLFGEMIGVWCAEAWKRLDKPDPFALVELGPGRGTMMQDLLRATANVGKFHAAMKLFLDESDEALRMRQKEALSAKEPKHVAGISEIPAMPMIIVANEFFDAFPVRQFEKTFRGWAERMVAEENGALVITLRPLTEFEKKLVPAALTDAVPGTVFEFSAQAQALVREIAQAVAQRKGAALIIDYGYTAGSGTSTLQAVSKHAPVSIFERPGEVDLTSHVDFGMLADTARAAGAQVSAVEGQGEFLRDCGIEIRAAALKTHATEKQAEDIDFALRRLMGESEMGTLFKVLEIKASL